MRDHAFRLAVWIIIASEALLFAGLFALYSGYRAEYPHEFHIAASHDISWIGGVNTFVLLASSFAMAAAVHFSRLVRDRAAIRALAVVLLLGSAFLVLKGVEWTIHIRDGFVPGASGSLPLRGYSLFFTLYYAMTGLHAAHVVAGLALVAWVVTLVRSGRRSIAFELTGTYWHFVDLVWVFLWPLFYLLP